MTDLRIVITGHSGVAMKAALQTLCAEFTNSHPARTASSYTAEGALNMPLWLRRELDAQQGEWRLSLMRAVNEWRNTTPEPTLAILALHLSYHWQSQVFSPFSWRVPNGTGQLEDTLLTYVRDEFKPHYFVNLIDDIQAVQRRLPGFKLRDLLKWRNIETMMTDILAKYAVPTSVSANDHPSCPYERCPVVSVRHPPSMLRTYLSEPCMLRVYISFPISEPRRRTQDARIRMVEEIDYFRRTMASNFCVFDPLTIDEMPIQKLASQGAEPTDKITLSADDQWPIAATDTLCGEARRECILSLDDVMEVGSSAQNQKSEIARQLESRDYRLIDQSDCVVIYRPTYERHEWTTGTYHEALYAQRTGKPIFVLSDNEYDGSLVPGALGMEVHQNEHFALALSAPSERQASLQRFVRELKHHEEEQVSRLRPWAHSR